MSDRTNQSFSKSERICSKHVIDSLFGGEKQSSFAFPLRMVYSLSDRVSDVPVSILVSVSKKRFHDAVDRNRMKRQIRESYRLNKQALFQKAASLGKTIHVAFICTSSSHCSSDVIERSMIKLLTRLCDQL